MWIGWKSYMQLHSTNHSIEWNHGNGRISQDYTKRFLLNCCRNLGDNAERSVRELGKKERKNWHCNWISCSICLLSFCLDFFSGRHENYLNGGFSNFQRNNGIFVLILPEENNLDRVEPFLPSSPKKFSTFKFFICCTFYFYIFILLYSYIFLLSTFRFFYF